jgi:hypothetical protein
MSIKKYIFTLLILVSFSSIYAQNVVINEPSQVGEMLQKFEQKHRSETTIKGWRIQIVTTDDRRKSESEKSKFSYLYPNVPVNWEHKSPYYVVRVGAYEKKIDLMNFLMQLKKDFPASTPVMDNIPKADLIR